MRKDLAEVVKGVMRSAVLRAGVLAGQSVVPDNDATNPEG